MRRVLWSFSIVVLIALAPALMLAGPPETVTIDECANKKAAVEFPHKAHVGVAECTACHHTDEGLTADSGEAQKCGACHNEPEDAATPKCSEMSMSKNHYHINCVKCHKDEVKKDASMSAPTKCDDCHPKS